MLEAADAVECCRVRERSYSMGGSCLQCTVCKLSTWAASTASFPIYAWNYGPSLLDVTEVLTLYGMGPACSM